MGGGSKIDFSLKNEKKIKILLFSPPKKKFWPIKIPQSVFLSFFLCVMNRFDEYLNSDNNIS